jgi:YfiH family protein
LVTKLKNVNLVLKTADCIPILFADSKQGLIAAAHAGRQGVQANICQVVVRKMLELSAQLENIIVEMGPAICDMHYQVSEDIQTEFEEATAVQQLPGFIQLKKTIRIQLNTLGITNKNILNNNICTFENPNYFSYRFNRTKQRQFSYIVRI